MRDTRFEHDGRPVVDGIDTLVVAGWTGRDRRAVEHHIRELAALGVAPPSAVPLFYRVSAALLGPWRTIDVVGAATSGEVEPLVVQAHGRRWLGVASDHTDRALEAHSVALSKQVCAKPCATALWPLEDVAERLDALELRAWIADAKTLASDPDGEAGWTLYQEGTLAAIRPLATLLDASPLAETASTGRAGAARSAMLCGTLVAIGGVRPASAFRVELLDPATGRRLRHAYAVRTLEVVT